MKLYTAAEARSAAWSAAFERYADKLLQLLSEAAKAGE
jgi:hypothetical protein